MGQTPNSDTSTEGIRVQAAAQFVPEHSDPERPLHLYAYRIRITNEGEEPVQLLRRRWVILDANKHSETVSGDGVVGHQPKLEGGKSFEYTSSCPLKTEWGTMEGTYTFARADGEHFDVEIGRFFLVPSVDNAAVLSR